MLLTLLLVWILTPFVLLAILLVAQAASRRVLPPVRPPQRFPRPDAGRGHLLHQ